MPEDETPELANTHNEPNPPEAPDELVRPTRFRRWLKRFKEFAKTRKGKVVLALVGLLVTGVGTIMATELRYSVLGVVFKSSAEVNVVDAKTGQSIPDATVVLAGKTGETDKEGKVVLEGLKPGNTMLQVSKKAYKPIEQAAKVTFRRANFEARLESAGIEISFEVTDRVTGQPVEGAELVLGEDKAISNTAGQILLSVLPSDAPTTTAKVTKAGYYLEATVQIEVKAGLSAYKVVLVPEGKVYFLSNRTGKIDLYESNLDGSEAQVVLAGTGKENTDTGLLPNAAQPHLIALVSNRDGQSDLFLFNGRTRKLTKIDQSVSFHNLRAWVGGDHLVYERNQSPTVSCNDLKAYRASTGGVSKIVEGQPASQSCPRISLALSDLLIYSVRGSDIGRNGLYSIRPSGQENRRLHETPSDSTVRQTKQTLLYEYYYYNSNLPSGSSETWYSLNLGSLQVTKLNEGPNREVTRGYVDSPSGKLSTFIEERDGKTELYVTDGNGGNERKLTSVGSVNQFVQWIGDKYIVFSSTKTDENALYIISPEAGAPVKVADFYRGNSRTYSGGYNPVY